MEISHSQVCDTVNSQCDVTLKSDVADVISKHLAAFFYKTSATKTFFLKKTIDLIF